MTAITGIIRYLVCLFECIPHWLVALVTRFALAAPFWLSGRTKVVTGLDAGFLELAPTTFFLFEHEYALPFLLVSLAAHMATYAEHLLPIMLVIGLATRFSALGLLGMTLVIQTFVYPGAWALHLGWAAMALFLVARGPGMVSIDAFLKGKSS